MSASQMCKEVWVYFIHQDLTAYVGSLEQAKHTRVAFVISSACFCDSVYMCLNGSEPNDFSHI